MQKQELSTWDKSFVPSLMQAVSATNCASNPDENILNNSNKTKNQYDTNNSKTSTSVDSTESSDCSSDSDNLSDSSEKLEIVCEQTKKTHIVAGSVSTKSVLLEKEPIIKDVSITLPDSVRLEVIGTVSSVIENSVVVVKAFPDKVALDLDSILFLEDKTVLGEIYETFGPVTSPYYVVCFKDGKTPSNLAVDQEVFFAPGVCNMTKYVFTAQLEKLKGSDASWRNDIEPPENMLDYSDDEEERRAKKKKSLKRATVDCGCDDDDIKNSNTGDETPRTFSQSRGRGRGSWTNRSISYSSPAPNIDEAQNGWVNAFQNLHSRRGNGQGFFNKFPRPNMPPPPPTFIPPFPSPLRIPLVNNPHISNSCTTALPPPLPPPPPPPLSSQPISWNLSTTTLLNQPPLYQFPPTLHVSSPPPPPPTDMSTLFSRPPKID